MVSLAIHQWICRQVVLSVELFMEGLFMKTDYRVLNNYFYVIYSLKYFSNNLK